MRQDDGVADVAAEQLPDDVRAVAQIEHVGVLSVEALLDVPEGCGVVVADLAAGVQLGEVVTVPLSEVRRDGVFPSTTHVIPPDEIIATAAELGGRAPRGVFVGIGGAEFGFADALSSVVQAALPAYVAALARAIRSLAAGGAGPEADAGSATDTTPTD